MNESSPADSSIRYAGFWIRVLSHIIDSIIITALLVPILMIAYREHFQHLMGAAGGNPLGSMMTLDQELKSPLGYLIQYGLPALAVIILWKAKAATPGKMMLHLKIADAGGKEKLGTGQCIIRYFGYVIPMVPLLFFSGFIATGYLPALILGALSLPLTLCFFWIMWDKRKQGWHDKLARTVVIRTE